MEGTNLETLTLAITGVLTHGMGPDAKFRILVPGAPWPAPITAAGTIGVPGDPNTAGHVVNGEPDTAARAINGSITGNEAGS